MFHGLFMVVINVNLAPLPLTKGRPCFTIYLGLPCDPLLFGRVMIQEAKRWHGAEQFRARCAPYGALDQAYEVLGCGAARGGDAAGYSAFGGVGVGANDPFAGSERCDPRRGGFMAVPLADGAF